MPGQAIERRTGGWRRSAAVTAVAAGCLFAGVLGASAEVGGTPDPGTWVTDGPVYAVARSADRTFIGGDFSYVGPRTGAGVPLAPVGATGAGTPTPDAFPEVSGGRVMAAAAAGDGSWYIGGDFSTVGGASRRGLARLIPGADGSLAVDTGFAPRPDGDVRALAVGAIPGKDDDVVYVGGEFASIDGDLDYQNLAALDRTTGQPAALMSSPDDVVRSIDVLRQDTTAFPLVIVGGEFANVGGTAKSRVAALWGDDAGAAEGTLVAGFAVTPGAGVVRAVHVGRATTKSGGAEIGAPVYVGGDFGLATFRVNVTSAGVATGGTITGVANPTFACVADCTTTDVRALATSADGGVLYIGGTFDTVSPGNVPRRNLVAARGVPDVHSPPPPPLVIRPWDPSPDGRVHALAVSGSGDIYVGGDFTEARDAVDGASSRVALAAVSPSVSGVATDPNDARLSAWNPVATGGLAGPAVGVVTALATSPSAVYAGGSFTAIGGSRRDNLAALDAAGRLVDAWAAGTDAPVHALAAGNDRLYVGGLFGHVNGQPRARLAGVAAGHGSLDATFQPAAAPACIGPGCAGVLSLALVDRTLYVGGAFASLAGEPRTNAGAVDAITGTPQGWAPNPDGNVYALLATCGTVYVGGAFSTAGGQPRGRLAAVDLDTGAATGWDPSVDGGTVYALARDVDVVYAGGSFVRAGGTERKRLAALDAVTGSATAWNPGVPGIGDVVRAIAAPPGSSVVYAGGRFTVAGGAARSNLAALDRTNGDAAAWGPAVDGAVRALASDGASVAFGGEFRQVASVMQQGFGSFGLGSGSEQGVRCAVPPPPPPEPVPEPIQEPVPPAPRPVGPLRDSIPPGLTAFSLTKVRFRTAQRPRRRARSAARRRVPVGTAFRYRVSEPGVLRFTFSRKTRVSCSSAKKRRPCYRWRAAGAVRHLSRAGFTKARFNGRAGRRWLAPGAYRVRARATDAAGNRSKPRRAVFKVVRR